MSTNRTKIDWAYKRAQKWITQGGIVSQVDGIRELAALLRLAERRGRIEASEPLRERRKS